MSIWKMLGFARKPIESDRDAPETQTVRKIVQELDHLEPDRARFVAAFSFILSRVAHADMEIGEHETRAMERLVVEHGRLPEEQAIIVVQMAKSQSLLFGGTENYLVTREFNRIATKDEKIALLDCMFAVAAADETVSTVEDNVMRQIACELLLDHGDFIAIRARFRDRLGVLKKPRPPRSP